MQNGNQPAQPLSPPALFLGRAAAALAGIAAFFAYTVSGAVKCSFAAVTHHPCPGCGGTRSARALLHLDFADAFRFNPVAPVIMLVLGLLALRSVWIVGRDGNLMALGRGRIGYWLVRALGAAYVLEVVVWVLRFFGLFGGPVPV